ncbi:MAG: heme ABC transporter permease [Alphaproteobacteria bacterium]|nr:MAG: heme ABC transporter permease [Alphaproteobacteria bacterium]
MHRYANPARTLRIVAALFPWIAGATALLFPLGLYLALAGSPADYQQGETVRIMYVHVPAAWLAMFIYSVMAVSSALALVWRHPVAELSARAAAPLGAGFTAVCLATGALWGQPMWGTWWVWDARLTSVLVLFFLYLGYIALADAFDDPERGGRAAGILAIVGWVNVPIVKFSVDWWNTLHQPASVTRLDAPAIHPDMLWPLIVMAAAFTALFTLLWMIRLRAELIERRNRVVEASLAEGLA